MKVALPSVIVLIILVVPLVLPSIPLSVPRYLEIIVEDNVLVNIGAQLFRLKILTGTMLSQYTSPQGLPITLGP